MEHAHEFLSLVDRGANGGICGDDMIRVITIADLADDEGTHIRDNMMNGAWRAGSDLEWPNQERPPKSWWTLFRKCIREAFSTRTPNYTRSHCSVELDSPLGKWYTVRRNTWWQAYKSQDGLYYRKPGQEEKLQVFHPTNNGYYKYEEEVDEVPLACHPLSVQSVGDDLWTHKPLRLVPLEEECTPLPGPYLQ